MGLPFLRSAPTGTCSVCSGPSPSVCAECLFVDPIADLAVLDEPDGQVLPEQWDAYVTLTESAVALPIADAAGGDALLLSLGGHWFLCKAKPNRRSLSLSDAAEDIVGGMSGSPILDDNGSAVGVVCISTGLGKSRGDGPNPRLSRNLPAWMLPPNLCRA